MSETQVNTENIHLEITEKKKPYINKSKSIYWGTPSHIKINYQGWYDPCPYPKPLWDGLKTNWLEKGKVFCNPPYNNIIHWAEKCYREWLSAVLSNKDFECHLLIPARTDTHYFHDYIKDTAEIEFIRGRLKFIDLKSVCDNATSAPFPSIICKYKNTRKDLSIKIKILST